MRSTLPRLRQLPNVACPRRQYWNSTRPVIFSDRGEDPAKDMIGLTRFTESPSTTRVTYGLAARAGGGHPMAVPLQVPRTKGSARGQTLTTTTACLNLRLRGNFYYKLESRIRVKEAMTSRIFGY